MGSMPMPLGQTAAPTGMVKVWFAGGEPWKDRSQVRCNFASIGNGTQPRASGEARAGTGEPHDFKKKKAQPEAAPF
ncbi:hypothetical protein SIAM614_22842 [Stappia aggregata IAM 12614]|uniref:Uncharacterized protein n=1 Tax=Roseibium aggregatum (strain ATCC 25650 / DSM 13394 / JCM 20685 / NBRC 16684 / NCIMB 2208 / IAM 12614 / B1) TaxID=384765 RepID=A0NMX5_ROSAI|nr:hypothetical protein SIAM614_22842 [Stappia aggregata IAM 12614] [Roseibium aggregatum IAM 12614]